MIRISFMPLLFACALAPAPAFAGKYMTNNSTKATTVGKTNGPSGHFTAKDKPSDAAIRKAAQDIRDQKEKGSKQNADKADAYIRQ